jgi:hypothetical protein
VVETITDGLIDFKEGYFVHTDKTQIELGPVDRVLGLVIVVFWPKTEFLKTLIYDFKKKE